MPSDKQDQILDLLLELLEERRRERQSAPPPPVSAPPLQPYSRPRVVREQTINAAPVVEPQKPAASVSAPVAMPLPATPAVTVPAYTGSRTEMPRTIWRMGIIVILFVILAQIPVDFAWLNQIVGAGGNSDQVEVLLAAEGMLLRGSGPPVYLIEDGQRRWITTLEALRYYGYRESAVRPVSDSYLAQFPQGDPIYVLLKCPYSPHIYALDVRAPGSSERVRRWIKDIPTFEAEGFTWEMVDETRCDYLQTLPDGTPFPADAGRIPAP